MSRAGEKDLTARCRATLRLQLHAGYTLDDARTDLPYFSRLGVSHLYLSPISQARTGSTHGYDVVDHGKVDAARGGWPALRRLAAEARSAGLGILLDIVPNHMATDPENAWWWDVLKHGKHSVRAHWFDIDWEAPVLTGKVLAPFLEKPYAQALLAGDIRLRHDPVLGFHVTVQGQPYPLAPESLAGLEPGGNRSAPALDGSRLQAVLAAHDPSQALGRRRLHQLLSRQHYCLAWWRRAADAINWRRFFEVSELIGVRVENQAVFDAVHALPLQLYAEGLIDGLRIDHVDGLAEPLAYCRRLREAMQAVSASRPLALQCHSPWLVVEKILAPGETLDERWAVDGTVGYDFAADVGALLHDGRGEQRMSEGWRRISGDARAPQAWLLQARQEMLERHFVAERQALRHAVKSLQANETAQTQHKSPGEEAGGRPSAAQAAQDDVLVHALEALLRHYPVYRSYVEQGPRAAADQYWFDLARQAALDETAARDGMSGALCRLDAWLGRVAPASNAARLAIRRFQQLTPPLAAKALEDTVFYRYGRLLSRNEVGSDPAVFALSVADFHHANLRRAAAAPDGLLATATHDHKRGEDARARLAILSEIPEDWLQACQDWMVAWRPALPAGQAATAFHYMVMQTLLGAWPPQLGVDDVEGVNTYLQRMGAWVVKALREGKQLSSWFEPQLAHEKAWLTYLEGMAPGGPGHAVLQKVAEFARRIEPGAIANGLIQTALRCTSPGVPDLYQGTEWRDFSLVDPDNRQPVDFQARARRLQVAFEPAGGEGEKFAGHLSGRRCERVRPPLAPGRWRADAWSDGRVKQAVLATLLALRADCPHAFAGAYQVLEVHGAPAPHLLAFCRGGEVAVVAAVKCAAHMRADEHGMPVLPEGWWGDAVVALPGAGEQWHDVLRGGLCLSAEDGTMPVASLLAGFPLAILRRDQG